MNYKSLLSPAIVLSLIASASALELPRDADVGVYFYSGGAWVASPGELVNWQSSLVRALFAEPGGDLNGRIRGTESNLALAGPMGLQILIRTPEGVSAGEYQLVKLKTHSDAREFRAATREELHAARGPVRDSIFFTAEQLGPQLWRVTVPSSLRMGEYAFLPPVSGAQAAAPGKLYTFSIGYCGNCTGV